MSVEIRRLLSCLYVVVLIIFQASCLGTAAATAAEMPCDPMGKPGAPLGTVWVKELEPVLKEYHLSMVQRELDESNRAGIQTNIAMFGLKVRMRDGIFISILDEISKTFFSGGVMLIHPETQRLEDIPAKRARHGDELGKAEKKLKEARSELAKHAGTAGSDSSNVDEASARFGALLRDVRRCETDARQASELISTLKRDEHAYALSIFRDSPRYAEHTNTIYDSEQTIARIVDHHISQSRINDGDLTLNGRSFKMVEIDSVILNLHTRTDMCPFCSMFLAQKLKEWQRNLNNIPVIAVVTSRQEYRCGYRFMIERPYYQGFSMRSFARRRIDDGSSFDGLKRIAAEGLVAQYAFKPEEIYPVSD